MSAEAISRFQAEDSTKLALEALRRDGVVIIEGVLSSAAIKELNALLEPHFQSNQLGADGFISSSKATTVGGIFGLDAAFTEHLMLNRHMLEISDAVLLPKKPMAPSSVAPAREPDITSFVSDLSCLRGGLFGVASRDCCCLLSSGSLLSKMLKGSSAVIPSS